VAFQISAIYKSLVRHVVDCADEIKARGISPDLSYHAFDSRGEEAELATNDLIGLAGWSFNENKGLWLIHAGITVSTINDENLFREIAIVDLIHDFFGEESLVPMRDPETGEEYTQLVVKEFEMMPAGQSEKRNYRPIGLELKRTSNDG
jgi:hypothetical protein